MSTRDSTRSLYILYDIYFTCHDVLRAHFSSAESHLGPWSSVASPLPPGTGTAWSHPRRYVSLTTYTAYEGQRTCVQACLSGPHTNSAPDVIQSLYCSVSPMLDSCMCKTAMASAVSTGTNTKASIKQRLGHVLGRDAQSS